MPLMFTIAANAGIRHCDGLTRRDVLHLGAVGLGGLTLPGLLQLEQVAAAPGRARAKHVIMLFLPGGPSQLDMWDLKPDAPEEIRGTFRPTDTNVPGIRISDGLPRMAQHADKYAILRAVNHTTGSHPAA